MRKYLVAVVALAFGGSAQAASAPTDDACRKIDRCVIKYAPKDGGAGKGHAVGFLGEASQHCDASHNPKAMFNQAAWLLIFAANNGRRLRGTKQRLDPERRADLR
jgi:hypothetical protein